MNFDEAITLLNEKLCCGYNISGCSSCDISSCEEKDLCNQLAEWLEEFKLLKQWKSDVMDGFCRYGVNSFEELVTNARNKALDDFSNKLKEKYDYLPQILSKEAFDGYIDEYAEQLKEQK